MLTREEIREALAGLYRHEHAEYVTLDALATEMYNAGDTGASEVVRRYVYYRSSFLDGVRRRRWGLMNGSFAEPLPAAGRKPEYHQCFIKERLKWQGRGRTTGPIWK